MFIHRGRLPGALPASRHIRTLSALLRRAVDENDDENNDKHKNNNPPNFKMALIVVGVIIGISVLALAWVVYRRWQRSRTAKYSRSGRDDNDHTDTNMDTTTPTTTAAGAAQAGTASSTVDRNTSVRSVMTLPPYRPKPLENEHVLGREGERDGIDVVIEMPTAEVEEELREEEMDALYRIRLARRRQLAEREERRLARRDARTRNDQAALQALREQTRAASTTNDAEIQALRNEHERVKETRQRAISSVSYADLGVARHDGTRIRANSTESERVGLLSDAASMAASARSPLLPPTNQSDAAPADGAEASAAAAAAAAHRRGRSASSVLSIDTTHSDGVPSVHPPRTSRSRTSSHSARHTRAGSSPELIDAAEADAGSGNNNNDVAPAYSPPGYEEVSLNDALTPAQSRSASPYAEPPPVYTGPTEPRASAESIGAAAAAATPHRTGSNSSQHSRRASRASGIVQLPSLRLAQLPQIVIEPSSAVPRDNDEAR